MGPQPQRSLCIMAPSPSVVPALALFIDMAHVPWHQRIDDHPSQAGLMTTCPRLMSLSRRLMGVNLCYPLHPPPPSPHPPCVYTFNIFSPVNFLGFLRIRCLIYL